MRVDPGAFAEFNLARSKEPRYVVGVDMGGTITYITSHDGIASLPGTPIENALTAVSAVTQSLNPDRANATIGTMSFAMIDEGSVFTDLMRTNLDANVGLKGQTVTFHLGYVDMDFADFVLFQTQIVRSVQTKDGLYQIECADIQRQTKTRIFELALTYLQSDITDVVTTIPLLNVAGFEGNNHGPSYSDAPSIDVIYIQMKQTGEIIRCPVSGISGNSFTGVTRGVLGSKAQAIDVDTSLASNRRPKVEEFVYLELPAVLAAYQILTGKDEAGTSIMPSGWHAGIDTSLVRLADFTGIGDDLWDTTDDTAGIVIRFDGIGPQDAKTFLETEIYLLLGLFSPIYADGQLGLRRMVPALADSPYVLELNSTNVIGSTNLKHDMESVLNNFRIDWNWNGDRFIRSTIMVDSQSIARHGSSPSKTLGFRGLFGTLFTEGLIAQLLTSLRDMYTGPPLRLTADGFLSLNVLEIGDPVRVNLSNIRDYSNTPASLQRTMVVHGMTANMLTGVKLKLFGSSERLTESAPTSDTSVLPSGFYAQAGTALSSVVGLLTGDLTNSGSFTLTGNNDLSNTGAIFYHDSDLTISSGTTINIEKNVQLRVNGFLTINGSINGDVQGRLGVADTETLGDPWGTALDNTGKAGFLGNSWSAEGVMYLFNSVLQKSFGFTTAGYLQQSIFDAFPNLVLQVDDAGNGSIAGLPGDLRGGGGPAGGRVVEWESFVPLTKTIRALGGDGGIGGGGLLIISKGGDFGLSGAISLDGGDGVENNTPWVQDGFSMYAGTGGAGAPGALLWLLDGAAVTFPDIAGKFSAVGGQVAISFPTDIPSEIKIEEDGADIEAPRNTERGINSADHSGTNFRIQYLAGVVAAEQDQDVIERSPGIGLSSFTAYSDNVLTDPPIVPTGNGDSGEWRTDPADLTNEPKWVSTKFAVTIDSGVWGAATVFGGTGDPGSTFGGGNVTDWEAYASFSGSPYDAGLQFRVDWANNRLYIKPAGNAGAGSVAYNYEVEVIGTTVTGLVNISADGATFVDQTPGLITFDGSTADEFGANGVKHSESVSQTGGADEIYLTLAALTSDVQFRVKVRKWNLPSGAVSVGDKWSAQIPQIAIKDATFVSVYFNPQDGQIVIWKGSLASAPASPRLNWAYYDTVLLKSRIWDGSAWQDMSIDGAVGPGGSNGTDGTDGDDAVVGVGEPNRPTAWTREVDGMTWDPATTTVDWDVKFQKAGVDQTRHARRITRDSDGLLTVITTGHKSGNLNTGRLSDTIVGSGTRSVNIQLDYLNGTDKATLSQTFTSILSAPGAHLGDIDDFDITYTDATPNQDGYLRVASSGKLRKQEGLGGGYVDVATWLGGGINSEFRCKLIKISGDTPGGTTTLLLDTWYIPTSNRTWRWTNKITNETVFGNFLLIFERLSDFMQLGSISITVSVSDT